jgi:drug/metabolite transporter (DMT)-like permease
MFRGSHTLTGSASAAGAMILVGSSVAAASALADYPIAGGQAARYGLASLLLLALSGLRLTRITRAQAGRLLALAASGLAGFNVLLIAAVRESDAATVGVIVGSVPVVLALAGPILEGRALSRTVVAGAAVVTAGAAAVQWSGDGLSVLGLAFALGALACEAAFSLLAVPLLATLGPRAVSTYACLLATPMLILAGLVLDPQALLELPSVSEASALLYLAALVTAAGFVLWYSAVHRLGVERAGLFAGLIPVAALGSAAAIGASALTPLRVVGALVVGIGVTVGMASRGSPATTPARLRSRTSGRGGRSTNSSAVA